MTTFLFVSNVILWLSVLTLGFLLLGNLRATGLLSWRVIQLEAITPSKIGRSGLKPGKKAPGFTLPSPSGGEMSLDDFLGRRVLLVFVQTNCGPCHEIVPELNRLIRREPGVQVLALNRGKLDEVEKWAGEVGARFPVLVQEGLSLAKRYEVFATPFAFLINPDGVILSKGIVSSREHIGYLLSTSELPHDDNKPASAGPPEAATDEADGAESETIVSQSRMEVQDVSQAR